MTLLVCQPATRQSCSAEIEDHYRKMSEMIFTDRPHLDHIYSVLEEIERTVNTKG
jgi:hypothetical protein